MPTRTTKPSAAARPSAAKNGGSGVFLDSDTTQHAHALNKPSAVKKGLPRTAMHHNKPRSDNESDIRQSKKA
jgi:hypothetical protein